MTIGKLQILDALEKLDPTNKDHWTADGNPKIDALGIKGLKRKEISDVAPQFTQDNPTILVAPSEAITLLGSSVQPSEFILEGDITVQLGEVVEAAQTNVSLTVEEWNNLEEDVREGHIQHIVDNMSIKQEEVSDAAKEENEEENQIEEKSTEEESAEEIKKELANDLAIAESEVSKATKSRDLALRKYDTQVSEMEAQEIGKTTQHDIMHFIKSQNAQRRKAAGLKD